MIHYLTSRAGPAICVQVADLGEELVQRYMHARREYHCAEIAAACARLGMDEREYCERRVAQMPPCCATGMNTSMMVMEPFAEAARRMMDERGG